MEFWHALAGVIAFVLVLGGLAYAYITDTSGADRLAKAWVKFQIDTFGLVASDDNIGWMTNHFTPTDLQYRFGVYSQRINHKSRLFSREGRDISDDFEKAYKKYFKIAVSKEGYRIIR